MLLIKLGGNLIAPKNREIGYVDYEVLNKLIDSTRNITEKIFIAHGAGNAGHNLCHQLFQGKREYEKEYTLIDNSVKELNKKVVECFKQKGLNILGVSASDGYIDEQGNLIWNPDLNFSITHGGIVRSKEKGKKGKIYGEGWEIYSGERLLAHIARQVKVSRLIFVTDVEYVYDSFPNGNPILIIDKNNFNNIKLEETDITGGMKHKVISTFNLCKELNCEAIIVNPDNYELAVLSKNLKEDVLAKRIKGTYFE